MKLKFSFRPISAILTVCLLIGFCFSLSAATDSVANSQDIGQWLSDHWAGVAFIVSEIISFLPVKAGGVVQAVWSVLTAIFKKK